ncbi:MAG: TonB-dependent receptor, partial [Acidobacteria bacterium]|nr:TonB-dependent receptor [Acidobacteriota bacterium]
MYQNFTRAWNSRKRIVLEVLLVTRPKLADSGSRFGFSNRDNKMSETVLDKRGGGGGGRMHTFRRWRRREKSLAARSASSAPRRTSPSSRATKHWMLHIRGRRQCAASRSTAMKALCVFAILAIFASAAFCQTAELTGTVTDPSGSVVPSAKVMATNLDTGVVRDTLTNERGNYIITSLLPGRYRFTAEATGFKQVNRGPIVLAVDQVARLDFIAEVGSVQESVTVKDSAVILDSATSTIGTVVENRQVTQLPLSGRNPIAFVGLAPGVRLQGGFGGKAPGSYSNWGNFSVNGGLANANTVLVEGLPLDYGAMNAPSFIPPVDATQEFRIQTNKFSAEFGRSAGGVVNFSIKSGTNQLHGSFYEFLRNKSLDANNFFQNRAGNKRAALSYNQFGASAGGPIRKDKTFFFVNYEGYRTRSGSPSITTVPTALERAGDFSRTFNTAGNMVLIADPLTTRRLPDGSYTRNLFARNVIPQARINPVAANLSQVWPLPSAQGQQHTNVNNFSTLGGDGTREDMVVGKLDHNLSTRWKFFGTYAITDINIFNLDPYRYKINLTAPRPSRIHHATLSASAVFSPGLIGEFHSGFARFNGTRIPYAEGFDLTTLGFPRALADEVQLKGFPAINVSGIGAIGGDSSSGLILRTLNSWSQRASMTWVHGTHTFKFGGNHRIQQVNDIQSNALTPSFSFNPQMSAVNPLRLDNNSGVAMASFMLGYPSGATVNKSDRLANQRTYAAFFFQDDWKATRKLTLNLGLEYSLEFPITERYNRKMWLDPDAPLPISQRVGLPLKGGFRFTDSNTRAPFDLYPRQWAPRVGFAYQLFSRMVVRGGYGMFWLPAAITEVTGQVNAPAWSVNTSMAATIDGGLTPFDTLSNPFPKGILNPPGSSQGLDTLVGTSAAVNLRNFRTGNMQQWNFGIQRELWSNTVFEIAYAGSKGTGLPAQYGSQLNQLLDSNLSLGPALLELVPNPFASVVQAGTLAQPTVQRGQLLRPFPQFTGLGAGGMPIGHSIYHSMQSQLTKRFSTSMVGVAYTIS